MSKHVKLCGQGMLSSQCSIGSSSRMARLGSNLSRKLAQHLRYLAVEKGWDAGHLVDPENPSEKGTKDVTTGLTV